MQRKVLALRVSRSCVKFSNYKKRERVSGRESERESSSNSLCAVATLARFALNYANLITKPSAPQPHTHTHTEAGEEGGEGAAKKLRRLLSSEQSLKSGRRERLERNPGSAYRGLLLQFA